MQRQIDKNDRDICLGLKIYLLDERNIGIAYLREGKAVKLEIYARTPSKGPHVHFPSFWGEACGIIQRISVIQKSTWMQNFGRKLSGKI